MEIYNENMERIDNPDLSIGYLKPSTRIEHHAAIEGVEEVWHYETIAEYPNGGKDIAKVVDIHGVEAQEARDEEIPIRIYVLYTQEQLDAMEAERNKPTAEQRIAALEERNAQLEEALALLLSGATEEVNADS